MLIIRWVPYLGLRLVTHRDIWREHLIRAWRDNKLWCLKRELSIFLGQPLFLYEGREYYLPEVLMYGFWLR